MSSSRPAPHCLTVVPVGGYRADQVPDRRVVEVLLPTTTGADCRIHSGPLQPSDDPGPRIAPALHAVPEPNSRTAQTPRTLRIRGVANGCGLGRARRRQHVRRGRGTCRGRGRRGRGSWSRRRHDGRRGARCGRAGAGEDGAAERGGERQGDQNSLDHDGVVPPLPGRRRVRRLAWPGRPRPQTVRTIAPRTHDVRRRNGCKGLSG